MVLHTLCTFKSLLNLLSLRDLSEPTQKVLDPFPSLDSIPATQWTRTYSTGGIRVVGVLFVCFFLRTMWQWRVFCIYYFSFLWLKLQKALLGELYCSNFERYSPPALPRVPHPSTFFQVTYDSTSFPRPSPVRYQQALWSLTMWTTNVSFQIYRYVRWRYFLWNTSSHWAVSPLGYSFFSYLFEGVLDILEKLSLFSVL